MNKKLSRDTIEELISITEDLNHIKDLNSLLEEVLFQTRVFTNSDAGSIYLADENKLDFSYFQNDTLEKKGLMHKKLIYATHSIDIDDSSIAGYAALTGKPVVIDDVYKIPKSAPYSFNNSFDKKSSYHTKSILTIPLVTSRQQIVGVMQVINAKDNKGNSISFSEEDQSMATFFSNNASVAIERAKMTREMILRMIKMTELRDPKETGMHVNRVGSYCVEIYQRWAEKNNISLREIKYTKDILRISAMLHDVGKIAISDSILKKPSKLDENEYKIMKTHSYQGSLLFDNPVSDLDNMSYDISYTHHERWDGKGYPRGLKGNEIPLAGRICAIADVYDALISARVYKEAWSEERVKNVIKEESGKHFDPEIVDTFFEIYDVIDAIRIKYSE